LKSQNHLILALSASLLVMLQACSSDPSPWSQTDSPWAHKADQAEEPAPAEQMEPMAAEPAPEMAAPAATNEIVYAPVEPAAIEAPVAVEPIAEPVQQEQAMDHAGTDLASMSAKSFTVQVCASRTMKQLKAFAKKHGLSADLTAKTTVKGETWFVLLSGSYASRADARQALAGLPQVGTKPWVRSVGSLQAVMSP